MKKTLQGVAELTELHGEFLDVLFLLKEIKNSLKIYDTQVESD
jgi:hypothetical protein